MNWGLNRLQFPPLPPGVHCCNDKSVKMYSIHSQIYKQVQRTYGDALVTTSFLMPNFRGGLTRTAWSPVSPASYTLELLAGRVVIVPFDGSTVVEGTVCPTTASSPDAVVHGILAAGLEKQKISNQNKQDDRLIKVFDCNQKATYLLRIACEELLCFLTTDRAPFGCPTWVSALGAGLCSLSLFSPAASSSAQPRSDISIAYVRFHENILALG